MNKIALLLLLAALPAFAADNIIVPPNSAGKAYLKDANGDLFPLAIAMTTDGAGNVIPISSNISNVTLGTVNQGTNNNGADPWHVLDDALLASFNTWKTWANVNLSTRASEATLALLNGKVTAVDTGDVTVTLSALPTGAATAAKQDTGNTALSEMDSDIDDINGKTPNLVGGRVPVDGSGVTQPVSGTVTANIGTVGTLATAAKQDTGNASVASLDTKTPALVGGRVPVDGSGVTQPVSGAVTANLGTLNGAATSAKQDTGNTSVASIDGKLPALSGGKVPVDGSGVTLTVAGTVNAVQSGVFTTRQADGSGNALTSQVNGSQRAADVGVNVAGVQVDPRAVRALTSADVVTANLKDSAGSSVTNGQKSMANSLPVVLASDQASVPVTVSGVATAANQTTANSSLSAIQTSVANIPASPATAGNQTTANSSLSTIATNTGHITDATAKEQIVDASGNVITSTAVSGKQRLDVTLSSAAADGSAAPTHSNLTGGIDGSGNQQALSVNTAGIVDTNTSLGTTQGKTNKFQVGTLVTTTTTADQVVLTYTVTAGKTLYIQAWSVSVTRTTFASTTVEFGNCSMETPSGTKTWTDDLTGGGQGRVSVAFAEPIAIPASTVVRIVCTPAATNSQTWLGNITGYEK